MKSKVEFAFLTTKGEDRVNVSHLTTIVPQTTLKVVPTPEETVVKVKMGGTALLPCKCGKFNFGGYLPPVWRNSLGEKLVVTRSVGEVVPLERKKYQLYNDLKRLKVRGDCSLVLRRAAKEDQGEYTCTYLEPEFELSVTNPYWKSGYITRKMTLLLEDLSPIEVPMVAEKIQEQSAVATTPKVNSLQIKSITPASEVIKSVNITTQITTVATTLGERMTSQTSKKVVAVTPTPEKLLNNFERGTNVSRTLMKQTTEEDDVGSSVTAQRVGLDVDSEFFDFNGTPEEVRNQSHIVQRREAKWKAYGFDSSRLRIKDSFAARNLWFQQLTHSVRSAQKMNCPCVVKIPSPGTWPSILETVPEPLAIQCQSNALSWLLYRQKSGNDAMMAISVNLFKPGPACSWLTDLPYINLLDQHENMVTAVPDPMAVQPVRAHGCFCSNNTHGGPGMFMGISECNDYAMHMGRSKSDNADKLYKVIFHLPDKQSRTVMVTDQMLPANVTIGNFQDIWWVCGDKAYLFLPYGWTGCCYMATLKLPYEVLAVHKGEPSEEVQSDAVSGSRKKREMAQFHNLEAYHWRISLGEKWGIGIFPWYGVTFLADHIDNITYTLQGFANETIKGFEYLSNTQRSHRLTLLKHDMALDYILAKQGGLCVALNLTGDACYTLVPDTSDNMTSVIDALKHIRDAFGASKDAGWSANAWLQEKLGPVGAVVVQILVAALLALCVMFCFCTLLLTFAKAMILRWVGVVMPGEQVQMPLLSGSDRDNDDEDEAMVIGGGFVDKYPF